MFSIVIAAWNAEKTLVRAVESITKQVKEDYEVLIIDDASTDSTYEIATLLSTKNQKIKFIKNSINLGPSQSRNIGVREARGRYIGFLDADDEYTDTLFSSINSILLSNEPDVIKFGVEEIYKNYKRVVTHNSFFLTKQKDKVIAAINLETLPLFGYAANGFYKASEIKRNQVAFDKNLRFAEDFFFNFSFFKESRTFCFIDTPGYRYYKTSNQSLSSKDVPDYCPLYYKKLSLLSSWAEENSCFPDCGHDLGILLLKSIYSASARKIRNKEFGAAYKVIKKFLDSPEFMKIRPFLSRKDFKKNIIYLPVRYKFIIIIYFLSYLLSIPFIAKYTEKKVKNKWNSKC